MPDSITPVAAGIQAPNANQSLNTLTGIIGLQQARQNLETGAAKQAEVQAGAATQQMVLGERRRIQQIMASGVDDQGNSIKDADGNPDPDLAMKWMPRVAPTTYPAYLSNIQQTESNKLGLKKSAADLSQTYRDQIGGILTGFINDPSANAAKVQSMLTPYGAQNPDAAPAISHAVALLKNLDAVNSGNPKADLAKKNDMLSHVISAFNPAFAPKPTLVDKGGGIQPSSVSAAGGVTLAGPSIDKTLPPQVISPPPGVGGGPAVVGGAAGTSPQPIGGGGRGPPGASPWQPYAGQAGDVQNFQNEVQSVRTEAQQAPLAHNINQQILRLSADAKTGPGSDIWQHVVGALGAPFGVSPTASYQEVGKFLEKNAISNMQAMGGPPSDTRLSAAAAANGSTSFSPKALQMVTKFNDATTTALEQYRQGIDHTVGMGAGTDYTKLPAFKAAWAKNFDVDVFRVENAIRDGDKGELAKIKSELGPARLKALAQKRQNLTALANGQMPQ